MWKKNGNWRCFTWHMHVLIVNICGRSEAVSNTRWDSWRSCAKCWQKRTIPTMRVLYYLIYISPPEGGFGHMHNHSTLEAFNFRHECTWWPKHVAEVLYLNKGYLLSIVWVPHPVFTFWNQSTKGGVQLVVVYFVCFASPRWPRSLNIRVEQLFKCTVKKSTCHVESKQQFRQYWFQVFFPMTGLQAVFACLLIY